VIEEHRPFVTQGKPFVAQGKQEWLCHRVLAGWKAACRKQAGATTTEFGTVMLRGDY
jgi:hypothetical protein